jgi:hypothetical protein
MKDNKLARAGLKRVGVAPHNPNWTEENASLLRPSEAYRTSGDEALMGEICRETPEVHLMDDARDILTARKVLDAMHLDPDTSTELLTKLGISYEEAEHVFSSVQLAKFANNGVRQIMPQPWWKRSMLKMQNYVDEPHEERAAPGRGTHYESRAAAMILNDPARLELMRREEEKKDELAFQQELIRREKQEEQSVIATVMLAVGGYLEDDFDVAEDSIKADVVKRFIRKNDLNKRRDYIACCEQADPPRDPKISLLSPQNVKYLRDLIDIMNSLDDNDDDKITWV